MNNFKWAAAVVAAILLRVIVREINAKCFHNFVLPRTGFIPISVPSSAFRRSHGRRIVKRLRRAAFAQNFNHLGLFALRFYHRCPELPDLP